MTITQRNQLAQRRTAIRALESAHVRANRKSERINLFAVALVIALLVGLAWATGVHTTIGSIGQ